MSEYAGSSSDLSEIEDGIGLKSDVGSNLSEPDIDADVESAPETEAETERLEISPQKLSKPNGIPIASNSGAPQNTTPPRHRESDSADAIQPGLADQNTLHDDLATSDDEDPQNRKDSGNRDLQLHKSKSLDFIGLRKRKRAASASSPAPDATLSASPAKKRSSSMRLNRKSLEQPNPATSGTNLEDNHAAILDESSADEAEDLEHGVHGANQHNASSPNEEDDANANDNPPDEEDAELPGDADDDNAEAEAEASAKTEDEIAKKRLAMDALVPIENLFAIFRDKLFDERWAELSAELDVLINPNTTHADYLAMRQALDARRNEKQQLEQVSLNYKIKALETRMLARRAQIHSQYFQTIREVRQKHMDKLNEQLSQIQRERRHCKTKDPQFIYNFEGRRSKQIANQMAYNTEVSLLSGIARHVGFPAAPDMRPASSQDIEEDLRQMKIQVKHAPRSVSSQIARAEIAATEEQFLEKTPWANPRHPAHQQARLDRSFMDPARQPVSTPVNHAVDFHRAGPTAAGSASTIGASDPPSGVAYSDALPNGSSPFEQMKRRDELRAKPDTPYKYNSSETTPYRGKLNHQMEPSTTTVSYEAETAHVASSEDNVNTYQPRLNNFVNFAKRPEEKKQYDLPRDPQDRFSSPPLKAREGRFAVGHENMPTSVGVQRPLGAMKTGPM